MFRGPCGVLDLKAVPAARTLGTCLWVSGRGGRQLTSKCVSMALGRGVWGAHAQTHAPGGEEPVDLPRDALGRSRRSGFALAPSPPGRFSAPLALAHWYDGDDHGASASLAGDCRPAKCRHMRLQDGTATRERSVGDRGPCANVQGSSAGCRWSQAGPPSRTGRGSPSPLWGAEAVSQGPAE